MLRAGPHLSVRAVTRDAHTVRRRADPRPVRGDVTRSATARAGSVSGAPPGSQPSSDRVYGYQRRSRPRRSCRLPAVTWLPWTASSAPVLVRSAARAAVSSSRASGSSAAGSHSACSDSRPVMPPCRQASAWRARSRSRTPERAASTANAGVPRARAALRARSASGSRFSPASADRPIAISQARLAASAASSSKSSRRPDRHGGGSTGSAAGSPGRPGGSGTAGIGAEGAGAANAVLASTPSSAVGRPTDDGVSALA